METRKPFIIMLIFSVLFSFLTIKPELDFIKKNDQVYFIAGRILWGILNCVWLIIFYKNLIKPNKVIVLYMITMMLYSFHGQFFVPGYYLGLIEVILVIGMFFPLEKKMYQPIVIVSTLIMIYLLINSSATYNDVNYLWDQKFRIDAILAVALMGIASLVGHSYITMKRKEKDEAYRKFLDIGKNSSYLFHDFKGLLSTPIFYADMLANTIKQQGNPEEIIKKLNEDLSFIQDYSKEIMKLTLPDNDSYEQLVTLDEEQVNKIEKTLNLLLRKQFNNVQFELDIISLPNKKINFYKLIKVCYNALVNSLESIKRVEKNDSKIIITFSGNDILIKDNGPGFPEAIIKKLNSEDSFITNKIDGSGIGTAIIKDLVKNMSGKVNFYNENGAVVKICL